MEVSIGCREMKYEIYVEAHQLGNGRPLALKFEEVRVYIFRSSIRRDLMAAWGCVCVSQPVC